MPIENTHKLIRIRDGGDVLCTNDKRNQYWQNTICHTLSHIMRRNYGPVKEIGPNADHGRRQEETRPTKMYGRSEIHYTAVVMKLNYACKNIVHSLHFR